MGGGIGQWLLFRAGDGSLSLFSLVVPPGEQTPVHDHLAWGLIGLYRGEQEEDVFDADEDGIRLDRTQSVLPGGLYKLFPPRDDVHRVRTVSAVPSVSIHLLTNDTGCVLRHTRPIDEMSARAYTDLSVEDQSPGLLLHLVSAAVPPSYAFLEAQRVGPEVHRHTCQTKGEAGT